MAKEFWLSDAQWAAIEQHMPRNQPGAHRVDDRRVISGVIHVLKSGCRWRDCPSVYGPHTTIYNRWNRWSRRRFWQHLFEALRALPPDDDFHAIDSTTAKAHRSAAGGKGGRRARRSVARAAAARQKSTPSAMRSAAPSPSKQCRGNSAMSAPPWPFSARCPRRSFAPQTPPMMQTACAAFSSNAAQSPLFRTIQPESGSTLSTQTFTNGAISSNACFAVSRTSGVSPPATTSLRATSYPPSPSQPSSSGGPD
jgi:transposase